MPDPQPAVPELQLQLPLCPICDEEVARDTGNYWCERCGATWPLHPYEAGEWPDDEAPRCTSIDGRYLPGGHLADEYGPQLIERRCFLAEGHDPLYPWAAHVHVAADSRYRWETLQQATPQQLAAIR